MYHIKVYPEDLYNMACDSRHTLFKNQNYCVNCSSIPMKPYIKGKHWMITLSGLNFGEFSLKLILLFNDVSIEFSVDPYFLFKFKT